MLRMLLGAFPSSEPGTGTGSDPKFVATTGAIPRNGVRFTLPIRITDEGHLTVSDAGLSHSMQLLAMGIAGVWFCFAMYFVGGVSLYTPLMLAILGASLLTLFAFWYKWRCSTMVTLKISEGLCQVEYRSPWHTQSSNPISLAETTLALAEISVARGYHVSKFYGCLLCVRGRAEVVLCMNRDYDTVKSTIESDFAQVADRIGLVKVVKYSARPFTVG